MDDTTRSALTAFQKDQGLNASGVLDDATKKALGMVHVQVAAAGTVTGTPEVTAAQALPGAGSATAETSASEQEQDDAIEEEEDGGWSLW